MGRKILDLDFKCSKCWTPAQRIVLSEVLDDLITDPQRSGHLVLRAEVAVRDRDLNSLCIAVRIHVGRDVKPRIQGRNQAHAKYDEYRDPIGAKPFDVPKKNAENCFHTSSRFLSISMSTEDLFFERKRANCSMLNLPLLTKKSTDRFPKVGKKGQKRA